MTTSILIVEDDPFTAALLEFLFQRAQFNVTLLTDGQSAWDYLMQNTPPDVLVLDVMLPHVNGMDLLQRWRDSPSGRSTTVIMLSAKDQVADIEQAFKSGADDYVVKPFDPDELLARTRRLMA